MLLFAPQLDMLPVGYLAEDVIKTLVNVFGMTAQDANRLVTGLENPTNPNSVQLAAVIAQSGLPIAAVELLRVFAQNPYMYVGYTLG